MSRLLFIDDEPASVSGHIDYLESRGHHAESMSPGRCLTAPLQGFDLIVVDLLFNDCDYSGLELARERLRPLVNVPLVATSAQSAIVNVQEREVFASFLPKDLSPMEFARELDTILEQWRSPDPWLEGEPGKPDVLYIHAYRDRVEAFSERIQACGRIETASAARLHVRYMQTGQAAEDIARDLGRQLFHDLFGDAGSAILAHHLLSVEAGRRGRVALDLGDDPNRRLPWELTWYSGLAKAGASESWLGGDARLTVCRTKGQLGNPDRKIEFPVRMLIIAPAGRNQRALDSLAEVAAVREAWAHVISDCGVIGPRQIVEGVTGTRYLGAAGLQEIRIALRELRPHVVHFVGHGQHEALHLDAEFWSDFSVELELPDTEVGLLVLNCCEAGAPGSSSAGISAAALNAGVGSVVSHLFPVQDEDARMFAQALYSGLARGAAVDLALQQARSIVWNAAIAAGHSFAPVLHVRDRFTRFTGGRERS